MSEAKLTLTILVCCTAGVALSMLDHHLLNGMLNDASFGLLMGAYVAGVVSGKIHS